MVTFTHLQQVRQGYFEHMYDALKFSGKAMCASVTFFVHAVIPDFFPATGSAIIQGLNHEIGTKKAQIAARNGGSIS